MFIIIGAGGFAGSFAGSYGAQEFAQNVEKKKASRYFVKSYCSTYELGLYSGSNLDPTLGFLMVRWNSSIFYTRYPYI